MGAGFFDAATHFDAAPEALHDLIDAGLDLDAVLSTEDLVSGECYFVASGITDGQLLRGVRYGSGGATTHSLVMRSRSGTIRTIEAEHQFHKLNTYGHLDFVHPAWDR